MLAGLAKTYPESSNKGVENNLTDAILHLMKTGTVDLADFSVYADDRDPDSVAVFVMPPSEIGLPAKQYYNDTNLVADYKVIVGRVLWNMGIQEPGSIVEFETKLASVTPDATTLADVTKYYNPLSVDETQSLLPEVSFSAIISELAPPGYKGDRLITTRETVQHFLKWKVTQNYVDSIQDPKLKPLWEFNNRLAGKDPEATEVRWRTCIKSLDNSLGWILSRFYVLDSFPKSSKELGDKIKVENIIQKIGYPTKSPDVTDAADVKQYYQGLNMSNETFENVVAVAKFELE
ncbi:endothelin-converting enzyme [Aspergillus sp. HF37]|nr:endothelin-converting enzyme [Aspergillus sp. HF37]